METLLSAPLFAFSLFVGMLACLELGRRIGARRAAKDHEGRPGMSAVEGSVYGLMGLLLAFTFSGATTRFEARRHLIVEETNAIGTAYLRIDLLPPETQPAMRENFRNYLDSRLEVYRMLPDLEAAKAELARATETQGVIWRQATAAVRMGNSPPAAVSLVLSSLNQMIDITTTRTDAARTHPPFVIFAMLFGMALIGSLVAGYGMSAAKKRNWLYMLGFPLVIAAVVFVIIDMEFPRAGLIQVKSADQMLVELRESMK
jgi:hypothetical protein